MTESSLPFIKMGRSTPLHTLKVLDTHAEERFNHIARIASRLFDVPIALIGLEDSNRQWFKSPTDLDFQDISIYLSFCNQATSSTEPSVIANALEDERFSKHPLIIRQPGIRFHAGCPLHNFAGDRIGTLSIIDYAPRTFTSEDLDILTILASFIERELNDAEQASQKNESLAEAAHALRTPIASVQGFADLLLNNVFDETVQKEILGIIREESAKLIRLINEYMKPKNS